MCVCVRVAVSPVGLSGYGLAAGEVAEQTQRGLSCSLTMPVRGFLAFLYSRSVTVENGPTAGNAHLRIGPCRSPQRPGQPWDVGLALADEDPSVMLS